VVQKQIKIVVSTHSLKIAAKLDQRIERFWDLEAVGVLSNEKPILEEFKEEFKFVDNRYKIKLLFKNNCVYNRKQL